MNATLLIVDETASGECLSEVEISVDSETMTVKDIIALRVEKEVEAYNKRVDKKVFNGLIQPVESEAKLNQYHLKKKRQIDAEKQVYVALDTFLKNGYFVFVDDVQVESLDQQIEMRPGLKVGFIKLTPLVGG